jgi:MarR family transcriptional regulator, transcriptional regulator for hemolysin
MQDTLAHPRARFGISFSIVARRWRRALDDALAEGGFADASWVALIHLHESGGGICQRDLAARAGLDGSSLVRLLDTLVARGQIERRAKASDRRANLVHLTDEGRAAVTRIRQILRACEVDLSAGIADGEFAAVLGVLDRIADNLDRRAQRGPTT